MGPLVAFFFLNPVVDARMSYLESAGRCEIVVEEKYMKVWTSKYPRFPSVIVTVLAELAESIKKNKKRNIHKSDGVGTVCVTC